MSDEAGYYRQPTVHQDTVVFVCEDDLWTVAAGGGIARRLTANPGRALWPALSPDGSQLAYIGYDEGTPEVYVMPAAGGPSLRLTYSGASNQCLAWTPGGEQIVFASDAGQPFPGHYHLMAVSPQGGEAAPLPLGPALCIAHDGREGRRGRVIGRNSSDIARWKRYRGGQTGDLWIDPEGEGQWRRLLVLPGNLANPLWLADRVYFVSDHEGVGNLYSCLASGEGLLRHTAHQDYYVRHPATDGRRIVYHAGADLFVFDPTTDASARVEIALHSPRAQRKRRFVSAASYLQSYDLHPSGHMLAVVTRGKAFSLGNWEGPAIQHGAIDGVRHRLATWLADGERIVVVSDAAGEEGLEVHRLEGLDVEAEVKLLEGLDIGRADCLVPAPPGSLDGLDRVALTNHRQELVLVDLAAGTARVLDHSRHDRIRGLAWSPDGRWLAYGFADGAQTSIIKLCKLEDGSTHAVTRAVLQDFDPAFDPAGRYLYFISLRDFSPVHDSLSMNLGFPFGMRPHLVTLQSDLLSPFMPLPRPLGEDRDGEEGEPPPEGEEGEPEGEAGGEPDGEAPPPDGDAPADGAAGAEADALRIDLDGITDRVLAFPLPEGRYAGIVGLENKVIYATLPLEAAGDDQADFGPEPGGAWPGGTIELFDLETLEERNLVEGVSDYAVSLDGKTLIYRSGRMLRVIKAGEKPGKDGPPGRKSGWLDLSRLRVSVEPHAEWAQMLREAWRLQRDHFWTPDMGGVDWQAVYLRYLPLIARVATRAEFSDLMWEMQGELGTSHAYEMGGDYRHEPRYSQGYLGADLELDPATDSYVVRRIHKGDVWDEDASSPLARVGANVELGDRLLAIDGQKVGRGLSPARLLVNRADTELALRFAPRDAAEPAYTITAKSLSSERPARYRDWVEANRRRVHEATAGRVGYVHVPDMGEEGYAEFQRGFLAELHRDGLIIDVRFNSGGQVSQLILAKLAQRRLGYDVQRWGEPVPYPLESTQGPMVALINEQTGSDGDLFSHAFKLMGLGPLIGTRTWGGVIGIYPRDRFVDGGVATQPEFSSWFEDVGFGVENHGTEPDIPVDISPADHAADRDPQMERALEEIGRLLVEKPPRRPSFERPPSGAVPRVPDPTPAPPPPPS